jgi:transposase
MMKNKKSTNALISALKRKKRKAYNSEDKNRIIIEGLLGETAIADLCRRESIHKANYYKWYKISWRQESAG